MKATARLYLDTARLGQMRRSSQLAVNDFAKLSGEVALTLYGKNFLIDGFNALPTAVADRYPHLQAWRGVNLLKQDLLQLFEASSARHCVLASRSLHLVRAGAELLARQCRRAFVPDLNWPPYAQELQQVLRSWGRRSVGGTFREQLFAETLSTAGLVEGIGEAFQNAGCDSVLLPAVTHDGIRLPVGAILKRLRTLGCRFAIVDACQHLGHIPGSAGVETADLVIAGVHKWIRAGLPLGLGIASPAVTTDLSRLCRDDPLFAFAALGSAAGSVMETVNVWPLLSCAAAVREIGTPPEAVANHFAKRLANARSLINLLSPALWQPLQLDVTVQSGILVLQGRAANANVRHWREHLEQRGIDVTQLCDRRLRISLPAQAFTSKQLAHVGRAFREKLPD
jgi:hypothetical protein